MDGLRLILILAGAVLVLAIYLWDRRRRANGADTAAADLPDSELPESLTLPAVDEEPVVEAEQLGELTDLRQGAKREALAAEDLVEDLADVPAAEPPADASSPEPSSVEPAPSEPAAKERAEELVVTLSVIAPAGRRFTGPAVRNGLTRSGLVYGDMSIYHAFPDPARPQGEPLFSVVNIVEPGTLRPEDMDGLDTPGLAMFMQLPGPRDGLESFVRMLETGKRLAKELGGTLCDATRSPVTEQTIQTLTERVMSHDRSAQGTHQP